MRCDLHVHSIASGMFTAPVLDQICRESYNDPREVYNRLKRLGMSIVTLTDHDSTAGSEVRDEGDEGDDDDSGTAGNQDGAHESHDSEHDSNRGDEHD